MDPNFPNPSENTVNCLLCCKEIPCTDQKKRRYFNHLQSDHNAFYNFNILFKINRLDINVINIVDGKASIAGDIKPDVNTIPPPNTVFCILCKGVVPCVQFFKHFQNDHNAQFNLNLMQKANGLNGSVLDMLDQHANVGVDEVKTELPYTMVENAANVQSSLAMQLDTIDTKQSLPYLPNSIENHSQMARFSNPYSQISKSILYKNQARTESRPEPHDDKLQIQFITSNPEMASKMTSEDWQYLDKTDLKKTGYKTIAQGHPLLANTPEDLKQKIISSNPSRSVKWTQSQRNYTQMCLDDYILKKNRGPYFISGKKGRVISWKCIVQYCPYVSMNIEGKLVPDAKPHNHPANPQYYEKRQSRQKLRQAVMQMNGPVNAIVLGVMRSAEPGAVGSVTALKQAARRYKHMQARQSA